MNSTHQLVKDCIKNNRQAQETLYKQYASIMLGLCYRYTKSMEDAEDVLQEGFIKVFNNIDKFRNEGDLGAWIRRIMVNTALTYLNKHNRYKKDMQLEDVHVHPVTDDYPDLKFETKQLVEIIRTIPSGYQTIFNLVAVEGYSHVEIAEMMQVNINTVRSQYKRARTMIIKKLSQNQVSTLYNE
jgi:RNA polymerase sigma factor (sigma-70 family)